MLLSVRSMVSISARPRRPGDQAHGAQAIGLGRKLRQRGQHGLGDVVGDQALQEVLLQRAWNLLNIGKAVKSASATVSKGTRRSGS